MKQSILCILFVVPCLAWIPLQLPFRHKRLSRCRANANCKDASDNHGDDDGDSGRRQLLSFGAVASLTAVSSCRAACAMNGKSRSKGYAVRKSDDEWRSVLSSTQYDILRLGATERPYSSILEGEKRKGTFACAGCGTELFDSDQKFKSGTGWPSFARALEGVEVDNVSQMTANLMGAELRCATCGGHLGDVFNDGFLYVGTPAFASGKRFCIDGAALVFQPSDGSTMVRGDQSPPREEPSIPEWLEPPKVEVRET